MPHQLLDHLVGDGEHRWRHHDVERSRGLKVDDEFEFGKLCDREVGGFRAIEDAASVDANSTKQFRDVGSVTHQPADFDITTVRKSHRNAVVRRQDGKLHAATVEESVGSDEEGIEALVRKGRIDLADRRGLRIWICSPMVWAAFCTSRNVVSVVEGLVGLTKTPTRTALGTRSCRSRSRFPSPPGRKY